MIKNKISDSQKAAQKRYDQKTKMVSIKYNLSEMEEYKQLKSYLEKTDQSMNGFVKGLIRDYFETGEGKNFETSIENKLHNKNKYKVFENIDIDDLQIFSEYFSRMFTLRLLSKYEILLENSVNNSRENYEIKLLIFMDELEKRAKQGEFDELDGIEKWHIIGDELEQLFE